MYIYIIKDDCQRVSCNDFNKILLCDKRVSLWLMEKPQKTKKLHISSTFDESVSHFSRSVAKKLYSVVSCNRYCYVYVQ